MKVRFGVLVASLAPLLTAQDSRPSDPVRDAVAGAVEWVRRQAVPVPDAKDAILFPDVARGAKPPTAPVYGGTAGVLIFLENVAAVLDHGGAREAADAATRGLISVRRQDAHGPTWSRGGTRDPASALYVGDAGIGHAFLVRAKHRKDPAALAVAVETGSAIIARGLREDDVLHWPDREVDVIFGAAGTLLFLLDLGAETGDRRFTDAALAAGRWLIRVATQSRSETRPPRLFWPCPMFGNQHLPNFSHGTAGVAYALARVAATTKDAGFLEGARDGAAWLEASAIRRASTLYWPVSAGEERGFGGWCHGPPGTARLFLFLHSLTGERRYLDDALASARWLISLESAASRPGAPALNLNLCCGVASVIDFFCDLHRASPDPAFAAFARRAGAHLLATAVRDADGTRWPAGPAVSPSFGVDLMQGTSGNALALLRLLTLDASRDPIRHLPDRTVTAR